MRSYCTLLALTFLTASIIAQNSIDNDVREARRLELETAFLHAEEDTAIRKRFEELAIFYLGDNTQSPQESIDRLKDLVQRKGDPQLQYLITPVRVAILHTTDSILESRKLMQDYLEQCRKFDDKRNYLSGLVALSHMESYAGNYEETLRLLLQALDYARDTLRDQEMLSGVYLMIGIYYYEQLDTLKAIAINKKALEVAKEINHIPNMASISNNLAMQYNDLAFYDSAKIYFHESIRLFGLADDLPVAIPLANLALVHRLTHAYDSALYYGRQSIVNSNAMRYDEGLAGGYLVLAQTFRDIGRPDSALIYFELARAIHEKINAQVALRDFYFEIAAFYASTGKHQLAYDYHKKGLEIKDLIFNSDNNRVLKEMDAKYQASQKEQALLRQEEQIKRQRILSFSMLAVAAFFLLLLFFIFRSARIKQKANTLLAAAKEKAEQSEKYKQQFLANMSHEIRTPMNAVMGMTNLLIDKNPRQDQLLYLNGIQKSSDTLLHIINDILDISKIEAGKIAIENIDFSFHEMVEQVKQTLRHKADEKGLELITYLDPDIPEIAIGDPTRLNQVIMNLAGNAIKFTEKGSVAIEIRKASDQDDVRFSIIDTGIGIPKDKLETVFESFTQAHSSDTRKFGGTGLGLTISKQLIELMGGKITVESAPGLGTTFSFVIHCPPGSRERLDAQHASGQIDVAILDGLKILVVDDNEYNRIVVTDTLNSKAQVSIMQAANGQECIAILNEHDVDVILMDVQMPVMNGYETTRYIRSMDARSKNQVPIIALTASVVRTDLDKCRDAGMNDYVPKPFKTHQLIAALAKGTGREITEARKAPMTRSNETDERLASPSGKSVTDLTYLKKFCEGDQVQMQKYITMFTSSAPALIEMLNTAVAKGDFEDVANQVHGYRTRWMMMGMHESRELASSIELQCREQIQKPSLREDIGRLIGQLHAAADELSRP